MSLKYKSPLIRSRNASVAASDCGPSRNAETPPTQTAADRSDAVSVYNNVPQQPSPVAHGWRGRGCSSPGFNNPPRHGSPRPPRGSPYQWTPPNRFNNSWSSDINNSGSSLEQNSFSSYKPHFNKYKKQNTHNWNNEKNDESYFHPSMLEDPWAPLLNNSANNAA